jgi:hypothetical protein
MSNPRQNRAGAHLQGWLDHQPNPGISGQERVDFLKTFFELADKDFADCSTDDQYRKVWVAVAGALLEHLNSLDIDSVALRSLYENLMDSALLRPAKVKLGAQVLGKTKTIKEEWARACVIALWEQYPDTRKQLSVDCSKYTDVKSGSIAKLVENFKNGTLGKRDLHDLVETARKRIKTTDSNRLKDFL